MRTDRTFDEKRILERIDKPLRLLKMGEWMVDPDVVDAPDIVLEQNKRRIGLEITRLDYREHCHWRHVTGNGDGFTSRAAEITINLQKMLYTVSQSKWQKYERYKAKNNLNECWLILFNDVFEFKTKDGAGRPDKRWFEEHARWTLQDLCCPFDRVWFNLQHPNTWYQLYKKSHHLPRKAKITRWPSIIQKEVAVTLEEAGVAMVDFDNIKQRNTFE